MASDGKGCSLPADVLWGSFVTHSFLPHGPWGRNECVTNEPQRTSAERLERLQRLTLFDSLSVQRHLKARSRMERKPIACYLVVRIWRRLEPLERIYSGLRRICPIASLESPTLVNLYTERQPFTAQPIKRS